jgi:acyl-CoA reductase-like NAD-dependent aldehyde dehydrogenase
MQEITSPVDGGLYKKLELQSRETALKIVENSKISQSNWKQTSLEERKRLVSLFVDYVVSDKEDIATELSWLIGRPKQQNFNEVKGFETRARYLISIADSSLQDVVIEDSDDFQRFMCRDPIGVVFIISAWNYPYLVSVNGIVPALLAGNTVILKQAPQTFPVSHRFAAAIAKAGFPPNVFQVLQVDHPTAEVVLKHPDVSYVHFTGSVCGGLAVNQIASSRVVGVGLELGGKDPGYVRSDCDPLLAAENLVDGAMYNSGQSCCAIERIYVHEKVYDAFVEHAVAIAKKYVLGNPLEASSNLGPVVNNHQAAQIRAQIEDAVQKGAKLMIPEDFFPKSKPGTPYVGPQILTNVNHTMKIMTEETFGPIVPHV